MESIAVLVLAAGLGKRMNSDQPKVAISTDEKPLICHLLEAVAPLSPKRCVVVTGHKREVVEQAVAKGASTHSYDVQRIEFAVQETQRGTGDAVKAGLPALKGFDGTVLVLCGDAPLLRSETLQQMIQLHEDRKATITLLSFSCTKPNAYGKVVRDKSGAVVERIIEAKDCSASESMITECNASIYAVDSAFLAPAVEEIKNNNAQGEYYFTDIVEKATQEGQTVSALLVPDADEALGVNTLIDLAEINRVLRRRRTEAVVAKGAIVSDPATLFIDPEATIAAGARIGPQVQLCGKTVIGAGVVIEGSAYLKDTIIEEGAVVRFSVRAENAHIGKNAAVGPFAHLRPGAELSEEVRVGNFVEVKNTRLAKGAKASHLTYLGDAVVGENTNIGAGTITCNYDGYTKERTEIGAEAFVGSNAVLVAPVKIGRGAFIAAGSTITRDVPSDSLALAREPQTIKEGWAAKRRAMRPKKD